MVRGYLEGLNADLEKRAESLEAESRKVRLCEELGRRKGG
jgi:hypothetical protein